MNKFRIVLLLLFVVFAFAACGPKYTVMVDAINSQELAPHPYWGKYVMIPQNEENTNNLYYENLFSRIRTIFESNGCEVVEDRAEADYHAFIDCIVTGPHEYVFYEHVPITGIVGYDRYSESHRGRDGRVHRRMYSEPRYGIIGYQSFPRTDYYFTHIIKISAFEKPAKSDKMGRNIWQIQVAVSNKARDIRENLPALLLTLGRYMTSNTQGSMIVDVYEKDGKLYIKDERRS